VTAGAAIRPATERDIPAIAELQLASARVAFAHIGPVEQMEAADVSRWLAAAETALVAELDGAVVGFAFVGGCELQLFYTHPRVWGRGAGRALLAAAEDALAAAGCSEAVVFTEERNWRPMRVYEAAGWRADGHVKEREWLGVAIREPRLRKQLSPGRTPPG
jgi:GNAT superfamily N-acetyltransferase